MIDEISTRTCVSRYGDVYRRRTLRAIDVTAAETYAWPPQSTYIPKPPTSRDYHDAGAAGDIAGARALAVFGDSITTDHISRPGRSSSTAGGQVSDEQGRPPGRVQQIRGAAANMK